MSHVRKHMLPDRSRLVTASRTSDSIGTNMEFPLWLTSIVCAIITKKLILVRLLTDGEEIFGLC